MLLKSDRPFRTLFLDLGQQPTSYLSAQPITIHNCMHLTWMCNKIIISMCPIRYEELATTLKGACHVLYEVTIL